MKHKIETTWADAYKWERMEQHLREASGSLNALHEYVLAKRDGRGLSREMTEGQFVEAYGHIYHHLNFAWNTRRMTEEAAEAGFEVNEKWPKEFEEYYYGNCIEAGMPAAEGKTEKAHEAEKIAAGVDIVPKI